MHQLSEVQPLYAEAGRPGLRYLLSTDTTDVDEMQCDACHELMHPNSMLEMGYMGMRSFSEAEIVR